MSAPLAGRKVLVTGGSRGLGFAAALREAIAGLSLEQQARIAGSNADELYGLG